MKKVVITGISRGIGKATAEKFLSEGWYVIGSSTSGASPIELPNLEIHKLNLADPVSIRNFVEKLLGSVSKIDVLVNNAAVYMDSNNETISIDILRKTLDTNLIGLIDLTEKLITYIGDEGSVINVSSSLGSITEQKGSYAPAYSISKAALNMYTRFLANKLNPRGITVSSIDPGWVRTEMGGDEANRDVAEPAQEIFNIATSKVDSGYFWYKGKKRAW